MTAPILLGGIDVFHLMNDRALRSRGLAGNHCLFVIELDGRLDPGRLPARLDRAVRAVPELRFRLDSGPLALGRPRWVVDPRRAAPPVAVREVSGDEELAARIEALLAARVDGERPWALDVIRRPAGGDVVVLRHFHALVDARGSDRLLRWLGSGGDGGPEDPPPPEERFAASERAIARLDRDARLALAAAYRAHVLALGRTPILSLAGAAGPGAPLRDPRVHRLTLSEDETRAFDRRVRERARLSDSSLMILAATRLADRALRARGFAPPQHVIPVPVSLDPKAGARRLLGNHLTMLLLALGPDELADERLAIARLAEQQRSAVRDKLDLGMIAALDVARWLPTPAYRWLGEQPFRGELASLIFSNPGAMTIDTFAGVPVASAYPLPTVVTPPGFQVICSRFAGRLSASIVHAGGLLRDAEAAALPEALRAELLGEPGAAAARTV
jgi:hypothetical protein